MAKKTRRVFTVEQKMDLVRKISVDIAGGALIKEACRKAGLHQHQYRAWKAGRAMQRDVAHEAKGGTETLFDVASLPPRPTRKKTTTKPHSLTPKQRAKIMARIAVKIKRGLNASDAALACGVNPSSYYLWKKKPALLAPVPAVYMNGQANGKLNGKHVQVHGTAGVQVSLHLAGVSIKMDGLPLVVSLEDAVRLQEGINRLVHGPR